MKIVLDHDEIKVVLAGYLAEKTNYCFDTPVPSDCYFDVDAGDPIENGVRIEFVWDAD